MASAAISDFLTDFGARSRVPSQASAHAPVLTVVAEPEPKRDVETLIAEAVAKAENDVTARLEALHETQLAAMREAHSRELDELHARQGEELGAKLAEAMRELEARIVGVSSNAAARVLAHMLSDAVTQRAVAELGRTLRGAVADADAVRIRVRGPQSLFLSLTEAMGDFARHLEFSESAGPDLSVTIDETLFETRLSDWSTALAEVIG